MGVSTHSRLKAAAYSVGTALKSLKVSTHSRPKAADNTTSACLSNIPFQHTAARRRLHLGSTKGSAYYTHVSTHSRPKAAAENLFLGFGCWGMFQHTAARRRLASMASCLNMTDKFQHTAARRRLVWSIQLEIIDTVFQHTAARRRLSLSQKPCSIRFRSPDFAKLLRKARTRV